MVQIKARIAGHSGVRAKVRNVRVRLLAAPGMLALTLALLAAPVEAGNGKITVAYSLLQERGGVAVATSLLEGFESGEGFRVRLRPTKESYVYLVVQRGPDDFRLLYPDRRTQRGRNRLEKGKDFIWPQVGWLRRPARVPRPNRASARVVRNWRRSRSNSIRTVAALPRGGDPAGTKRDGSAASQLR